MIIESRIYYLRVLLSKIAKNMYFSVPDHRTHGD